MNANTRNIELGFLRPNGMAARRAPQLSCSGGSITLALHFNYSLDGRWFSGTPVAVKLLERVLLEVRPHLPSNGTVAFRMDKLLYSQELNERSEKLWRQSLDSSCRWRGPLHKGTLGGDFGCPLDRVLVVVVSGIASDACDKLCKRLGRFRTHPFLGALVVDIEDRIHQVVYLSERMTAIGILRPDGTIECGLGCLEYSPEIDQMWAKHGIDSHLSRGGMHSVLDLLGPG